MHHGVRTKYHLCDPGLAYGELKWMAHRWSKRGLVNRKRVLIRRFKRQFARAERRRGKREVRLEVFDDSARGQQVGTVHA